jgi:hypothetical protein
VQRAFEASAGGQPVLVVEHPDQEHPLGWALPPTVKLEWVMLTATSRWRR